jgi:hypothetical protein
VKRPRASHSPWMDQFYWGTMSQSSRAQAMQLGFGSERSDVIWRSKALSGGILRRLMCSVGKRCTQTSISNGSSNPMSSCGVASTGGRTLFSRQSGSWTRSAKSRMSATAWPTSTQITERSSKRLFGSSLDLTGQARGWFQLTPRVFCWKKAEEAYSTSNPTRSAQMQTASGPRSEAC